MCPVCENSFLIIEIYYFTGPIKFFGQYASGHRWRLIYRLNYNWMVFLVNILWFIKTSHAACLLLLLIEDRFHLTSQQTDIIHSNPIVVIELKIRTTWLPCEIYACSFLYWNENVCVKHHHILCVINQAKEEKPLVIVGKKIGFFIFFCWKNKSNKVALQNSNTTKGLIAISITNL